MTALLEVSELTLRFGGLTAVDAVSFSVEKGSITAVIGPNGAGKTSLFNAITAQYQPSAGRILLEGATIERQWGRAETLRAGGFTLLAGLLTALALHCQSLWSVFLHDWNSLTEFAWGAGLTLAWQEFLRTGTWPFAIGAAVAAAACWQHWHSQRRTPDLVHRHGIARTFQNIRLFRRMSCLENILIPRDTQAGYGRLAAALRLPWQRQREAAEISAAMALLELVGLTAAAHLPAGSLPYGAQRRLEIARALSSKPRLLLLDEPAAGMNESESADLMRLIRDIRAAGTTILLIEHDMQVVMGISDSIVVLDHGEKIAAGTPTEIRAHPAVIVAYLGETVEGQP